MRCTRNAVYPLGIGGSNPSLSAKIIHYFWIWIIIFNGNFLEIVVPLDVARMYMTRRDWFP